MKNKSHLLFYNAYEDFYTMASHSQAFQEFCKDAFGEDFSQDGFSDIKQIQRILQYIPVGNRTHGEGVENTGNVGSEVHTTDIGCNNVKSGVHILNSGYYNAKSEAHILDIGCGNGKMLGYLQKATGAYIHGFDYSEQAIKTARELFPANSEFTVGVVGEIDYAEAQFDVITSMDTMYFAKDMSAFVAQVKRWLKPDGIFFVGYQEGDVIPKTESAETTLLTKAIKQNGMKYEALDITGHTYDLLKRKRECAVARQAEFEAEGNKSWFDMLMFQTECATVPYEEFREKMARYIYVVRK